MCSIVLIKYYVQYKMMSKMHNHFNDFHFIDLCLIQVIIVIVFSPVSFDAFDSSNKQSHKQHGFVSCKCYRNDAKI